MRKAGFFTAVLVTTLFGGAAGLMAQQQPSPSPPPRIGDRLIGTSWQAESLRGEAVAEPAAATVDFLPGDHVRGQAGCKRFVAPFATRADKITIGPIRTSLGACDGAEAGLEGRMVEALEKAERVELGEGVLVLHDAGGEPSRFVPRAE